MLGEEYDTDFGGICPPFCWEEYAAGRSMLLTVDEEFLPPHKGSAIKRICCGSLLFALSSLFCKAVLKYVGYSFFDLLLETGFLKLYSNTKVAFL